jgi:TolA-binding protein
MRKLCLLACLLFLILVFPIFAADLDNAKTLYEEKQYESALVEFKQVFESSTGDTRLDALLHILRCDYFLINNAELASYYNTYKSEAENTSFEPDIHFTYANSLMDSVKDYASARSVYNMLYQEFPNAPFAGSGSLLKLGDIDVLENKPNDALSRYNELETKYPDCPYIDNALLGKVKAFAALKDRASLLNALQNIRTRFPDNPCTAKAGIEAGIYFAKMERHRDMAIKHFREVANEYPDTPYGSMAELRLADLAEGSRLKKSIALYQKVLSKPQFLGGTKKYWAQTELGVNLFLNEEYDQAAIELQRVIDSDAPAKFKERAQIHLGAISDPQSISAAFVHIDAAVRYRRDFHAFDTAYWSFRVYTDAWKAGKFEAFLNDPNIPDAEKAKREYQLSLAYYNISYVDQSDIQAKNVVEKYPHIDYYCASAKYSLAHHKEMGGRFLDAIDGYMEILEKYPDIDFAPKVMTKIADCFIHLDRQADAVYVYDCIAKLYPYRKEGMGAKQAVTFVLRGRPDLVQALELARGSGGSNLAITKLPSPFIKLPPILERLDRMKEKLLLAQAKDKGESFEDLVTDIK